MLQGGLVGGEAASAALSTARVTRGELCAVCAVCVGVMSVPQCVQSKCLSNEYVEECAVCASKKCGAICSGCVCL